VDLYLGVDMWVLEMGWWERCWAARLLH